MSIEEIVGFCTDVVGVNIGGFLDEIALIDERDPAAVANLRPCPFAIAAQRARRSSGITVARTFHGSAVERIVRITCPTAHILVTASLTDADLSIVQGSQRLIGGRTSLGTVVATGLGGTLTITSQTPCDLIHLAVPEALLRRSARRRDAIAGVVVSDPLIGRIAWLLGEAPSAWLRVYADLLSQLLVARLYQLMPAAAVSPLPEWRLKRVRAFVDANLDEPLRLADLAAVAGLSRMYFAAQFRAATGMKPHDYVLARRVAQAKGAIAEGDTTLVDIALDAGFQSQAHFCTIFKRLTGVTPSEWRRQAAAAEAPTAHRLRPAFRPAPSAVGAANHLA